jgi:phage host-nuclease inhibitor protein Gam
MEQQHNNTSSLPNPLVMSGAEPFGKYLRPLGGDDVLAPRITPVQSSTSSQLSTSSQHQDQEDLDNVTAKLIQMQDDLEQSQKETELAAHALAEAIARLHRSEDQVADERRKYADLKREFERSEVQARDKLQGVINSDDARIKELKKEVESNQFLIANYKAAGDEFQVQIKKATERFDRDEKAIADLAAENESLKAKLSDEGSKKTKAVTKKSARKIKKLKSSNKKLEKQLKKQSRINKRLTYVNAKQRKIIQYGTDHRSNTHSNHKKSEHNCPDHSSTNEKTNARILPEFWGLFPGGI